MIVGTGLDLVHIPRVRALVDRWGREGLKRIFAPQELEYAFSQRRPCCNLAGQFASKEAMVKAMGGLPSGASLREVRVLSRPGSPPEMVLEGMWTCKAQEMGIGRVHLSITHAGEYAMAQVILETEGTGDKPCRW